MLEYGSVDCSMNLAVRCFSNSTVKRHISVLICISAQSLCGANVVCFEKQHGEGRVTAMMLLHKPCMILIVQSCQQSMPVVIHHSA